MSNIRIAELPEITIAANDNVFIINDSLGTTSKITWQNLQGSIAELNRSLVLTKGSSGVPAISFGDTSAGIFSPDSGQLGFATMGFGRMYIGISGKIGIGTLAIDDECLMQFKSSLDDGVARNLNMGNNRVTFLKDPQSNSDAATKNYVDLAIVASSNIPNLNGLAELT